jgi:hypothetical protein
MPGRLLDRRGGLGAIIDHICSAVNRRDCRQTYRKTPRMTGFSEVANTSS